jgi:hypothetical protein
MLSRHFESIIDAVGFLRSYVLDVWLPIFGQTVFMFVAVILFSLHNEVCALSELLTVVDMSDPNL